MIEVTRRLQAQATNKAVMVLEVCWLSADHPGSGEGRMPPDTDSIARRASTHPFSLCRQQIHDELVWEVEEASLAAVARIVKLSMEEVSLRWNLIVPMPVRMRAGPSWGELEDLSVPAAAGDGSGGGGGAGGGGGVGRHQDQQQR